MNKREISINIRGFRYVLNFQCCCILTVYLSFFPYRPVNLLDSYENRFGNALAFGVTTSFCLNVLIGDVKSVLGTSWGTIIDSSPGFVSSKHTFCDFVKIY